MSEAKPATPTAGRAPRRRVVPLITSILIVLLLAACAAEGYIIYLKQLEIASGSMDSEVVKGRLTELQTNLDQANLSLAEYAKSVGYPDPGDLRELVKDAPTQTVRGLLSEMNTQLTLSRDKVSTLESTLEQRDKTIAEKLELEGKLRADIATERHRADLADQLLKAEKDAHANEVKRLEGNVKDWTNRYNDLDGRHDRLVDNHNRVVEKHRELDAKFRSRVEMLRVLLARSIRVPAPAGLSRTSLIPYQLQLQVTDAKTAPVEYVVLSPHPRVEAGMRFNIYGSDTRRAKCLAEVQSVHPDRAHAQVVVWFQPGKPVKPGDLADLDLAYEEIRRPDGLPVPQ